MRWRYFIFFVGLLAVSGCSKKWEVELFNVFGTDILVSIGVESIPIEAGKSALLEFTNKDIVLPGLISISTKGDAFCYDLPPIRSGGYGDYVSDKLRIRLMLDLNGLLFVYSVSQQGFVFGQPPGDQPSGYPVKPIECI